MQVLQTLTLAEVKAKAREFYKAKKLTAQHPDPERRACVNDGGDGYRCAVAAAFNDDVLAVYPTGGIWGVHNAGVLVVDDLEAISYIQQKHDDWAGVSRSHSYGSKLTAGDVADAEQRFVALIQD